MVLGIHYLVRIRNELGELAYQITVKKVANRWAVLIPIAAISILWLIFGG